MGSEGKGCWRIWIRERGGWSWLGGMDESFVRFLEGVEEWEEGDGYEVYLYDLR